MKRLLIIIGILCLIAITYLCFTSNAPSIEKELTEASNQSLNDNNLKWAQASANGQSIILTGISPSNESKDKAESLVYLVNGVTHIKNEIVIKSNIDKSPTSIVVPEIKNIIVKKDNSNEAVEITEIENCQQQFDNLLASHSIQFQTASAQLSYSSLKLISELSDVAKRCTKYTIVIEGHTDAMGDEQLNKTLSQSRADSVRSELVTLGIAANSLIAIGLGETHPIADNTSDRGRKLNRRIEFKVEGK